MSDDPSINPDFIALSSSIGRLDGKVDLLLQMQSTQKETTDDHETRIRTLEKTTWKQAAFITGVSATVSTMIALITKLGLPS
jgi:hypothetical protein